MKDFKPGTIIESKLMGKGSSYTVLDPVRTSRGKLRLEGPRGGYVTTWWTPNTIHLYRLKVKKSI